MTYEEVKKIRENPTSSDVDDKELAEMIDKAIDKQIAKKCNLFVDTCECGYRVYPHMKYCSQCGKKLKWGDKVTEELTKEE